MYVCMHACMCVRMYVCMHAGMYVGMYVYKIYASTAIYIYMNNFIFFLCSFFQSPGTAFSRGVKKLPSLLPEDSVDPLF